MYTVGSLQCFPDPLAEFKGERIEGKGREWVKQEWSNNGRWGKEQRKKRKEIGIHATRGPLQLFSRGCAYN